MPYAFASPGPEYLEKVGALAYSVSSLEWTLLGDLPWLSAGLPADFTVETLATKETGRIAGAAEKAAGSVTDPAMRHFLVVAASALSEAAKLRNNVLHARPATVDGEQRLYRWTAREGEQFAIEVAYLDGAITRVGELLRNVGAARVPR